MSGQASTGPPACRALFERLSDYIDGELPTDLCSQIEEHMGDCSACQEFLASLRGAVELMRDHDSPALPDEICKSLRTAYERYRRDSGQG